MSHIKAAIAFFLVFILLFLCLICIVPDQFSDSYQRAIVLQYDYFHSLIQNKIVFIGGSSLSFGLDLDDMEQYTDRPCAILGNHFGDGLLFQLNMAKSNLQAGDVVVVEYDSKYSLDSAEPELLFSGVGKRYDLHRFFPSDMLPGMIQSYSSYFTKNLGYWRKGGYEAPQAYSLRAYDSRGNMTALREECLIPLDFSGATAEKYGYADFYSFQRNVDDQFVQTLNEFFSWCESKQVSVFITHPVYYDAAVAIESTPEVMAAYDNLLAEKLNAPVISKSENYIFPRDYIYDTISHCNTLGAERRTELLYADLKPFLG